MKSGRNVMGFFRTLLLVLSIMVGASPLEARQQTFPAQWNWETQQIGDRPSLRGVHVVSSQVAWVSGQRGTVARTTDGGINWTLVSPPDTDTLDFRDVHAWDDKHAVVMVAGQPARFYSTSDGGQTWKMAHESSESKAFFDAMDFESAQNGWAFSDPVGDRLLLVRSRDRGQSWEPVPTEKSPQVLMGEAGFAASGSCICLLGGNIWIGLGGNRSSENAGQNTIAGEGSPIPVPSTPARARILKGSMSNDQWQFVESPLESGEACGIFSIEFCTPQVGVAVGGDYQQIDQRENVACFSRDGGTTWQSPIAMPSGYRSAVAWLPYRGKRLWVCVGPNGTDGSDDDGEHWAPLSTDGFHAVSFSPDGLLGIAVGSDGRVGRWRQ